MNRWMDVRLCLVLIATSIHVVLSSFMGSLTADMEEYKYNNQRVPTFRCTADSVGQNSSYYLDHLITWSKIGRDGREKYLSINWDLTVHGKRGQYMVSSDYITSPVSSVTPTPTPTPSTSNITDPRGANRKLYFFLSKPALTPDDHGEYVCRLHDFDKNLLAEASVPVVMFDKQLAVSPYKTEAASNTDIAVNCKYDTSEVASLKDDNIILSHVPTKGKSKKIAVNGNLTRKALGSRYTISTFMGPDGIKHHVLTIKSISKKDAGKIRCELRRGRTLITSTAAEFAVDTPKLVPTPTFYLQMPVDSIAHFKCACAPEDIKACRRNNMAWTFINKYTGNSTLIYKDGQMMAADRMLYKVVKGRNGSLNLTINGVRQKETEGEFICWLHKRGSMAEIAHASIPVSVTPIAMGVMAMMDQFPLSIKLLCTVTGTRWNHHYLETHSIAWYSRKRGVKNRIAVNSRLSPNVDASRISVIYYSSRYYSILTINNVLNSDSGEYTCQLLKNQNNLPIKEETLSMYGKGNTTIFAGSYAT